jgi:hypothetical protein
MKHCATVCFTICFTICLCISPDLDGNRGTTICFTICLCISLDLDEYQGNKNETFTLTLRDPKKCLGHQKLN